MKDEGVCRTAPATPGLLKTLYLSAAICVTNQLWSLAVSLWARLHRSAGKQIDLWLLYTRHNKQTIEGY